MIVTHKMTPSSIGVGDRVYFGVPYGTPYVVWSVTEVEPGWFDIVWMLAGCPVNHGTPYRYAADDLLDVEIDVL